MYFDVFGVCDCVEGVETVWDCGCAEQWKVASDLCGLCDRLWLQRVFATQTSAMMIFKNLVGRSGFLKSRTMSIGAICIGMGVIA